MALPYNPDATLIPDKAEVWLALKSEVSNFASMMPTNADADLGALGWGFSGLIDEKKGIPLNPGGEVTPYDAFGKPNFRYKFRKGELKSGFTVLETNAVTRKIVLPGSAANKIGLPRNIQTYVAYRWVDDDIAGSARAWVSLMPALAEHKGNSGVVEGEKTWNEIILHHVADANGDVFQIVGGAAGALTKTITVGSGVTSFTVTVDGYTTAAITTLTAAGVQTALRALSNVGSSGVTVTGSGSGPFTATFLSASSVSAAGTGGTVTVA